MLLNQWLLFALSEKRLPNLKIIPSTKYNMTVGGGGDGKLTHTDNRKLSFLLKYLGLC